MKKLSLKKLALKTEKISNFDNLSIKGGSKKTVIGGLTTRVSTSDTTIQVCMTEC